MVSRSVPSEMQTLRERHACRRTITRRTDLRGVYLELGTGDGTVLVGINKPQNVHQYYDSVAPLSSPGSPSSPQRAERAGPSLTDLSSPFRFMHYRCSLFAEVGQV